MILALFFKKKLKLLGRIAAKEVKKEISKTPERAAAAKHRIVEAKHGWQELRAVMRATRNPLHGLPQPHPAACPPPLPQTAPEEVASCFYTYAAGQAVACIATPAPDEHQPSRTFSAGVGSAPPAAPQLEWKMVPTHQLEAEQATARRRSIDLSAAAQATAAAEAAMLEAAACAAANGVPIGGGNGGASGGSTPAATGTPPSSRRARSARAAYVSARAATVASGGNSGGASSRSGGGASNRSGGGGGGGASNRSGSGSNRTGHGGAGGGVGGASGSGSFNSGNTQPQRKRSFKSQVAAERALRSTLDDTRSCSIQAIMAEAAAAAEAAATAERAGDADGANAFARAVDAVETRDRALAALVAAAAKADSDGPSRAPSCVADADADAEAGTADGTGGALDGTVPSRTVSRDPARDALAALERSAIEALSSCGKAGSGNERSGSVEESEEERPAWKIALEEMRAADALAAGAAAGPAPAAAPPVAAPAFAPAPSAAPAAAPPAAAALADLTASSAAGSFSTRKRCGTRRASGVQEALDALDPADLKSYMRKVGAACAIESGASAHQKHRRRRTKELAATPAVGGSTSSRRRTKPPDEVRV